MTKGEIILLRKLENVLRLPRDIVKKIIGYLDLRGAQKELDLLKRLGFKTFRDMLRSFKPWPWEQGIYWKVLDNTHLTYREFLRMFPRYISSGRFDSDALTAAGIYG